MRSRSSASSSTPHVCRLVAQLANQCVQSPDVNPLRCDVSVFNSVTAPGFHRPCTVPTACSLAAHLGPIAMIEKC
jgi:hypothetical protein